MCSTISATAIARRVGSTSGLTYYQKALAIDPNFVLAREYLGEGYVAAGKFDLAREQLHEIGKRCGTNCEEYMELAEVIEGAS